MVPEGWRLSTVEEIAKVTSGGTPSRKRPDYWGGSIPWVTTAEVDFGEIRGVAQCITEVGLDNSSAKLFPAGTILMAMYGQGKTRGKVAKLGIEASTNQACAALLLHEGYEKEFYYQYLASRYESIRELANSGGQDNLSAGIVKSIQVPVPPPQEQRKIAKILSTWDEAIVTTEQLLANSEQQKKVLMQQLLTGKKRLPGFEGEWAEYRLGELGDTYSGLAGKTKEDFGDGLPFITYMNVFSNPSVDVDTFGFVKIGSDERQHRVQRGDIFFTVSSETPEDVGMSSVLLKDVGETYLNSFCFGFRLHEPDILIPEFAQFLLRAENVRRSIARMAQGATRYNLSKKQLMALQLALPSEREQAAIARVLSNARSEIDLFRHKIHGLREEKKALMQQLLTGKRRVKVEETQTEAITA